MRRRTPSSSAGTGGRATAKDVGNQTRTVLGAVGRMGISAANALAASRALHERTGHTAGNGSLMRTAPSHLRTSTTKTVGPGGRRHQRADSLRSERRRGVRPVVLRHSPRGAHRRAGCARRASSPRRRPRHALVGSTRHRRESAARPTSGATAGWSRRCRPHGRAIATTPVPVDDRRHGRFRARPPATRPGRGGSFRQRHRHRRRDRGRPAGCRLRRVRGPGCVAALLHGWPG